MGYRGVTFGTFVTALAVLIGIYFNNYDDILQRRLIAVLHGLEKLERSHQITVKPKVVIGYGICTDIFVDAKYLLEYSDDVGEPQHFNEFNTYEELLKGFAYYFRHGAASERYVANSSLFDKLVTKARASPSSYSLVGRNAAIMALRFHKENCDVTLAAKMTKSLRSVIPAEITVVGESIDRDDTHLILEYKRGDSWGPYISPRANRFIIHNDVQGPNIHALDELEEVLETYQPNLLVISGLHVMDNYPSPHEHRIKLLEKVKRQMTSQPESTRIHFEMASFVDQNLVSDLCNIIIPFADSLGMNEQEIANLQNILKYGNISLVVSSTPKVATVLDQMRTLFKLIREKGNNIENSRQLTRIHVHTLAYQIIMTEKNSAWKNTAEAAAKASLTAHRHVCGTQNIDLQKATLIMDDSFSTSIISGTRIKLDENNPVSCWEETFNIDNKNTVFDICVAPVLVCTESNHTAGGGDNISSAGLALQI